MAWLKPMLVSLGKTGLIVLGAVGAVVALIVAVSIPGDEFTPSTPLEHFFAPIIQNTFQTLTFGAVITVLFVVSVIAIWKYL